MSTNLIRKPSKTVSARRVIWLTVGLCLVLFSLFAIAFWRQNQNNLATAPPDFQLAVKVDLAARSYDEETLAQLTLEETAVVSIYFTIQNVNTHYLDLGLLMPDGQNSMILHGEEFRTDREGSGSWEKSLPPGTYQMVLTADQSPGNLSVYWKYQNHQ